ncbi:hypothetical protein Goari_006321, partial [Gossypium aridum]|nr:hypothetical protein [Gossypium aridum]
MLQDSGYPCFKGGPRAIQNLRKRFHLSLTEEQCVSLVLSLISSSLDAWRTRQYDYYQRGQFAMQRFPRFSTRYIFFSEEGKGWFLVPTSLWSVLYLFEEFVTVSASSYSNAVCVLILRTLHTVQSDLNMDQNIKVKMTPHSITIGDGNEDKDEGGDEDEGRDEDEYGVEVKMKTMIMTKRTAQV